MPRSRRPNPRALLCVRALTVKRCPPLLRCAMGRLKQPAPDRVPFPNRLAAFGVSLPSRPTFLASVYGRRRKRGFAATFPLPHPAPPPRLSAPARSACIKMLKDRTCPSCHPCRVLSGGGLAGTLIISTHRPYAHTPPMVGSWKGASLRTPQSSSPLIALLCRVLRVQSRSAFRVSFEIMCGAQFPGKQKGIPAGMGRLL